LDQNAVACKSAAGRSGRRGQGGAKSCRAARRAFADRAYSFHEQAEAVLFARKPTGVRIEGDTCRCAFAECANRSVPIMKAIIANRSVRNDDRLSHLNKMSFLAFQIGNAPEKRKA